MLGNAMTAYLDGSFETCAHATPTTTATTTPTTTQTTTETTYEPAAQPSAAPPVPEPTAAPTTDPCLAFQCSRDCHSGSGSATDAPLFMCGWDTEASLCRTGEETTQHEFDALLETTPGACSQYTDAPTAAPSPSPSPSPTPSPTASPSTSPTSTTATSTVT